MQYIGNLDKHKLDKYKNKMITDEVILTKERLEGHILITHKDDYNQLSGYLKHIIEDPDIIIDDNRYENTIIVLKRIPKIKSYARVVIKVAVSEDIKHTKNSIITLMKLNDRTWKQTLKNRGDVIFKAVDNYE